MSNDNVPSVTGISPAEGPPGTIVKIRGENLGKNEKDLRAVVICNVDCTYTAEWKSSRLIHARTGNGFGLGEINVFTTSGGMGTSTVRFRGYVPRVGLLTEAAVWVNESKLFEEKQQAANLSNRRAFSPNATYTDPLGVAPEETGAVLPIDKINEWYPETTSNPLATHFNPARFLLEKHLDTSFDALKSGYYHLQSKDTRKSVGPTSFVRGHLTTILEALHTLNEVHSMHTVNESESIGGNICEELQGVLKSCDFVSNSLFKHILSRKDDADAKRNVLNVLHRYRFLFNLPRSIEKSIQQREYEILISDYNRAKALFQNTEVTSFKKALSEVDQKIAAFSTQLKQKLFDFPTPLEEQKKIIRYLNDLDYPGNAGWECITKQALWIKSMLLDCQVEHQMITSNANNVTITTMIQLTSTNNKLLDESRPQPFFTDLNKLTHSPTFGSDLRDRNNSKGKQNKQSSTNDSNSIFQRSHKRMPSLPELLQKKQSDCSIKTPAGILMVEALCTLITENVSDLWSLGQTYLSQQLGEKKDTPRCKKNESEEFQAIVKDVIVVFCEMVQTVVQPEEQGKLNAEKEIEMKSLVPWLPGAVKCVRSTLDRLMKLGLAKEIISPLKTLATNAIGDCIKKVLSTAVHDIKELSDIEKWQLDYSQADYCTSLLPGIFEKIFMESVLFAHDYIADSKLDEKVENRVAVHKVIIKLLEDMLQEFLLSLERTVYKDTMSSNENLSMSEVEKEAIPKDMQVLVLLSNCEHVKNHVIPRVMELCIKKGFEDIENLKEDINTALQRLDERVFATYIDMRGDPLVGEIELGINQGESGWDIVKPIQGIRRYIQDILMNFTFIHHQVSSMSTLFTNRIFTVLYEMITEEFLRIFECIPKFSSMGALQARVELEALRCTLDSYGTEKSRENLEKIFARIPELNAKDKEEMRNIMVTFKKSMRYQLATFQHPEGEVPEDPKEGFRQRSKSNVDLLAPEQRERVRSKGKTPKKNRSPDFKVEVQEGDSQPVSTASASPATAEEGKKTKRKAPPPPKNLVKTTDKNPFLDDDEKEAKNPFVDDEVESGNPFLDDEVESGNPFLDDDGEDETGTNPFID